MINGFIYEWTDTKTGLKYRGRHEGSIDDGYIASGTIINREYNNRPEDFVRIILWESSNTTVQEIKDQEEYFLSAIPDDELYYGINRKYYNQIKTSDGYTSTDNPMKNPEIVARMVATSKERGHKNVYENSIAKYSKEEWSRMQSERKQGNKFGSGNKGKPKTEAHCKKISESIIQLNNDTDRKSRLKCIRRTGRKPIMSFEDTIAVYEEHGTRRGAEVLGINYAAFKSRVILAKKKLKK